MKQRNRWLKGLLVLCLLAALIPVAVNATEVDSGTCGENVRWSLSSDWVLTISGTGPMDNYDLNWNRPGAPWNDHMDSIQHVIIEDGVTSIGNFAFAFKFDAPSGLTSISIPNSVTSIGESAFYSCRNLTSVTIPDRVTAIGLWAFFECTALTNVVIPEGVTRIETGAFAYCENMTSVTIPNTVKIIESSAFEECHSLKSVTFPASVTKICDWAFGLCDGITELIFCGNVPYIESPAFRKVNAIAYYPADNATWTPQDLEAGYGGTLTWVPIEKKPAAPMVSVSQDTSSGKIRLAWNRIDNAAQYEVYRADSETNKYTLLETTTATSFADTSAVAGDRYDYYVVSVTADALRSDCSSIITGLCILAQPSITLGNRAFDGAVTIQWDKIESATKYEVYRAPSKNGTYTRQGSTGNTSYTNTSAKAGTTYYYKVRAICDNKDAASAYSTIKSRTCDLAQPVITLTNRASDGAVSIQWDAIDGANRYEIHRAASKTGTYSKLGSTANTFYTNTTATVGKTYYYKIRAVCDNENAASAYSAVKYRVRDLAQPKVSTSNAASTGKIKLTWDAIDGATAYTVYRATAKNGEYKLMKTTTATSYINTSATAGKTYYYKVKAMAEKSAADSAYSEISSRTCDLPRPEVTIGRNAVGKPQLSWEAVDGAASYKVYRATAKNGEYKLMKTTTNLSYTNTSAVADTTYYYKVVAVASKAVANSAYSSIVSIQSK